MNPVTRDTLGSNAFRTLGLSASANQSAVESAARKMRIWPDPSRVPPTPWDLPSLGPLRRSKPDIERAVALLSQPESRLEHRLLWFGGDVLPGVGANTATSALDRHAVLLADLQATFIRPESEDGGTPWSAIVARVQHLFLSSDLQHALESAEDAGRFEKRASPDEIAAKAVEAAAAITAGVISRAISALDDGRIDVAIAIGSAVANGGPREPAASSGQPLRELLDRLEDSFNAAARDLEKDLRDNLRTNHKEPAPFHAKNRAVAERAFICYRKKVLPAVSAIKTLAANDPDGLTRISRRCAVLLGLLALGWEWGGEFDAAENSLFEALNCGRGTLHERELQLSLGRVGPLAAAERARLAQEARYPGLRLARSGGRAVSRSLKRLTTTRKKQKPSRGRRTVLVFISMLVAQSVVRYYSSSSPSPSSSSTSPYRDTEPEINPASPYFRNFVVPARSHTPTTPQPLSGVSSLPPPPPRPLTPMPQNFSFGGSTSGK